MQFCVYIEQCLPVPRAVQLLYSTRGGSVRLAIIFILVLLFVVYLYLTSAKCTGIAAFSLWPEATALTEMVKVELHERKKMKFYNV